MFSHNPDRRQFAKLTLGTAALFQSQSSSTLASVHPNAAGIKLCAQSSAKPSDEELLFLKQIGAEYVSVGSTPDLRTADGFQQIKKRYADAGITVWNIGNTSVHNMPEVTLNLPGRDQKIADYKQYLRNLGRAGIYYTTYAHMGNGIWSSANETTRGGAPTRAFHTQTAKGHWINTTFEPPLTQGRKFSEEELWENYTYFIKQVAPVAEETGVRIGIHPDDPPMQELGGVPRCIFGNFNGYVRALKIANSPNVGVCLCCGTWMEGGRGMGKDVLEALLAFAKMGKLWKIHFRNVSAPNPGFVETFVDNGYTDMKQVMRALVAVDFRGILIADHVPQMIGDRRTAWAYSIGYIKALYDMAHDERRGP